MHEAEKPVLVHISLTVTLVYVMFQNGLNATRFFNQLDIVLKHPININIPKHFLQKHKLLVL